MPAADLQAMEEAQRAKTHRLAALRSLLAEKFPAQEIKPGAMIPTGLPAIDRQAGGLRKGAVTELAGSPGAGRLFIEAMLAVIRRERCFAALIDAGRSFDPQGCSEVALRRLLLVFCPDAMRAVKAADLLLRDGNLPLVLLDLQMIAPRELRRVPPGTWHRFQRLAEQTATAFVVLSSQPMVAGATARIAIRSHWTLGAMRERRRDLLDRMNAQVFDRSQFSSLPPQHSISA